MLVTGLFSGIGGFELAFTRAGFATGLLVELDPFARSILERRFAGADVRPDVTLLKALPRDTQILTAGFPCQNLSMAGDKSGIHGTKSGIVHKMFDLIARRPPPIVVVENVYFMLHLASGKAMDYLVQSFEALKYRWAYRVLDTRGFGLPQRRRRVYLVAARELDPRTVLFADETPKSSDAVAEITRPIGFYWTEGRSGVGITVDGVPPLKTGSSVGIPSPPAVLFPDGQVLTPSLEAAEKLQGFSPGWTRAQDGSAKPRLAWRLVGNAVSVPVAEWVASRIHDPGAVLDLERHPLRSGDRWPMAAWNVGQGRQAVIATDRPVNTKVPSIERFRDGNWAFLSNRALDGFISRAEAGGLKMPQGFLLALRRAERKAEPLKGASRLVAD